MGMGKKYIALPDSATPIKIIVKPITPSHSFENCQQRNDKMLTAKRKISSK
jgi:hypothetical protein